MTPPTIRATPFGLGPPQRWHSTGSRTTLSRTWEAGRVIAKPFICMWGRHHRKCESTCPPFSRELTSPTRPIRHMSKSCGLSPARGLQPLRGGWGAQVGRPADVVKPVRKFPGRKFFYGNRKKILLGKTVTLTKESNGSLS